MAEESNAHKEYVPPPVYDLNAKWDACLDLTLRRGVYYSFAGAFGGLLLFRSPAARWAAIAFGAGAGLGSAYSECSYKFAKDGGLPVPHVSNASKWQCGMKGDGKWEGKNDISGMRDRVGVTEGSPSPKSITSFTLGLGLHGVTRPKVSTSTSLELEAWGSNTKMATHSG
nr:MICOS complex subunit Mic10-like [Ipomoea batatas]